MKKSLIPLIAVFAISSTVFAGSFPDVAEDYKHYEAIEYLDDHQIINGYEDGSFQPDGLVNRAEALKMIVGATGVAHDASYNVLFPDVPSDQWFFEYVMGAQFAGIVGGYEDGTFQPTDTVNLAETMKMLVLASKIELPEVEEMVFVDVAADDWFAPYFAYARSHNLILSDDFGYVYPDQEMTRGSFAEIVYRMMVVLESDEGAFPLHLNWPAYQSSQMPFSMRYDPDWKVIEADGQTTFLRANKEFMQFSAIRSFPDSASVRVAWDKNDSEVSVEQYFANLKTAFAGASIKEFNLDGRPALEILMSDDRIVDWYVYLENDDVVAVYTEYGSGGLGYQLQQIIKSMLETFESREVSISIVDYSGLISNILEMVLIEGKGMEALNTLPGKLIIETDTIGVGTGPVDYYYSAEADYTFKYERTLDVILDSREGKTTTF